MKLLNPRPSRAESRVMANNGRGSWHSFYVSHGRGGRGRRGGEEKGGKEEAGTGDEEEERREERGEGRGKKEQGKEVRERG